MTATLSKPLDTIDAPYSLTDEQLAFYAENEYIKLKDVFDAETLDHYHHAIKAKTLELNTNTLPMEERDTYSKAFIQVINLWRHCEVVKEFVFGKRLASIANQLMQTEGVRLYHDQALFKEPSGGFTPWHADQQYWPLDTEKTITAWIPLLPVSLEMGPLSFAAGSQQETGFRDLAISAKSERTIGAAMEEFEVDCSPFDLGEVSFHSGWLYHNAPRNASDKARAVITVIYMDSRMRVKEPDNPNQRNDRKAFCPGVEVGEECNSAMTPILYGS
jgi:ectoine hydroxylase-related dioxygenase (phytanoyl-CoA dioxygenase family)